MTHGFPVFMSTFPPEISLKCFDKTSICRVRPQIKYAINNFQANKTVEIMDETPKIEFHSIYSSHSTNHSFIRFSDKLTVLWVSKVWGFLNMNNY